MRNFFGFMFLLTESLSSSSWLEEKSRNCIIVLERKLNFNVIWKLNLKLVCGPHYTVNLGCNSQLPEVRILERKSAYKPKSLKTDQWSSG